MAMLVMTETFARTWAGRVADPEPAEFWPMMIGAVHRTYPDFTFIAEADWDLEWDLQQQGFDFCYDKRLYDGLIAGDAAGVQAHLRADPTFQSRLVRFVENHDEPRVAALCEVAKQEAVTMATLTQAGARLVYDGQLTGRRVRLPVFLGRSPREAADAELTAFHRSLLTALRDSTFRNGVWSLCETTGPVAWSWDGEHRWLVIVNLSPAAASGDVRVPWVDTAGQTYHLVDPASGVSVIRSGDDLVITGAKTWISNARRSGLIALLCKTDPSATT